MAKADKPRILCIDDQAALVAGMRVTLRREYDVTACTSGREGLVALAKDGPFAVLVVDMRMPEMDGNAVLRRAREIAPDTVRMLLTGYADTESAITAVNDGQIFRFLTKPCPPPELRAACQAAVELYSARVAERDMLSTTLRGCVEMIGEVLALANPLAFGRGERLKVAAGLLAERFEPKQRWQIEVAAALAQVGYVTLPPPVLQKLHAGEGLDERETILVQRVPEIAERLVRHIPRLEGIGDMIREQAYRFDREGEPTGDGIGLGGRILAVVNALDELETTGLSPSQAVDRMRSDAGRFDPAVLDAIDDAFLTAAGRRAVTVNVQLEQLESGMRLAADLKATNGTLLMARGQQINIGLLERLAHFPAGYVVEPIAVLSTAGRADAA